MYWFLLIEVVRKCPYISEYILTSLVVLGSTVVQYTTLVLIFSCRSVSWGFYLVDYNPCLIMWRCHIVVFPDFSRYFLISLSVRSSQVFRKPFLIAMRRLSFVGMKSASCKYWSSYGFEVFTRILFTTFSDCCGPRGTYHIPVFLFMFPLIISSPFF